MMELIINSLIISTILWMVWFFVEFIKDLYCSALAAVSYSKTLSDDEREKFMDSIEMVRYVLDEFDKRRNKNG